MLDDGFPQEIESSRNKVHIGCSSDNPSSERKDTSDFTVGIVLQIPMGSPSMNMYEHDYFLPSKKGPRQ